MSDPAFARLTFVPAYSDDYLSKYSAPQSRTKPGSTPLKEPYHWKGLILQSMAFDFLQNGVRIMTANQHDRHILLNKPFWADYTASLANFNMRRWNDGDPFVVNYIGHPLEGAIAGYIQIQNDPRGRDLKISRDKAYWHSRFRAFLWATTYSTFWELGPIGEAGIFNEGGFTYPLGCRDDDLVCQSTAKYTNNTGWVDFIVTPIAGTLLLIGEDAVDRFLTDPLVERHPHSIGFKVLRAAANPNRSMANILRGRMPYWRDYEHTGVTESKVIKQFEKAMDAEPVQRLDLSVFYSSLGLGTNHVGCINCRNYTPGIGGELGVVLRPYLDLVVTSRYQPDVSPISTMYSGGSFSALNIGLRSGYSGHHFALRIALAPGFATYSKVKPQPTNGEDNAESRRTFNFSATLTASADLRVTKHLGFRTSVDQMLIRYKSDVRDPPGIGTPPNLSFLSHDNYINSTNWGVRVGPVFQF